MAVVPIIKVPNEKLKQTCEEITVFDDSVVELAQNLLDTLKHASDPPGAGLAAPQIGVLKRMVVVLKFSNQSSAGPDSIIGEYVLVNPKIIKESQKKHIGWEACLSIPDQFGQVERPEKIRVEAYNEYGEKRQINASGFFGRVIQHEIDHLDGILFTDKNRLIGETMTEEQFDDMLRDKYSVVG